MEHDLIVVGGGLGGSAVATAMARAGAKVLVLEREERFRDRVRGDMIDPWGVAEARRLGLGEVLERVGHVIGPWCTTVKPLPRSERDLPSTTPSGEDAIGFFHPELQEALLRAADAAGAEVRRGFKVAGVEPSVDGAWPVVIGGSPGSGAGASQRVTARLVIGADGRDSGVRSWGGFTVTRDPPRLVLAGALVHGLASPERGGHVFFAPSDGLLAIVIPIGQGRHRVYGGYELKGGRRNLSGPASFERLLDLAKASGAPAEWFDGAELSGPLAAFDGADHWVESPYRAGVVLVGDAAAASDPSFGCGTALTLRDARVLSEELSASDDWYAASRRYAAEHDRYFGSLHTIIDWLTQMYRETGPEADARRRRAFPLFEQDRTRIPDVVGSGPDGPSDETARRRFFGEE
ncbi:MAG TPA: FAD-dependent monooxygenase [Trueperaceae bacterium]|nr:FAD-dependent monooxygenase [Trueperaceae bacterium]